MPYLCDVKNKLNSITMKYKSRSIAKVIVPVFLVVISICIYYSYHGTAGRNSIVYNGDHSL